MSVTAEVLAYLIAQNVGTADDLFRDEMPPLRQEGSDDPDVIGCVYEGSARPPEREFGSATARWEFPNVELVFRGKPNQRDAARAAAKSAWDEMLKIQGEKTLSGTRYVLCTPLQSPFPMRKDEKQRHLIACNFSLQKEPS